MWALPGCGHQYYYVIKKIRIICDITCFQATCVWLKNGTIINIVNAYIISECLCFFLPCSASCSCSCSLIFKNCCFHSIDFSSHNNLVRNGYTVTSRRTHFPYAYSPHTEQRRTSYDMMLTAAPRSGSNTGAHAHRNIFHAHAHTHSHTFSYYPALAHHHRRRHRHRRRRRSVGVLYRILCAAQCVANVCVCTYDVLKKNFLHIYARTRSLAPTDMWTQKNTRRRSTPSSSCAQKYSHCMRVGVGFCCCRCPLYGTKSRKL